MHSVSLEEFQITPVSLLQLLGDRFLIVMQSFYQCSPQFSLEIWGISAASFVQGCLDAYCHRVSKAVKY